MRIRSQWQVDRETCGIELFSVWWSRDFWGFVLFGFVFEWARTEKARRIQDAY